MDTKVVHLQPGVLLRGYQLSVGVSKIFFFLYYPFFKSLKIPFKFTFPPTLILFMGMFFLSLETLTHFSNQKIIYNFKTFSGTTLDGYLGSVS